MNFTKNNTNDTVMDLKNLHALSALAGLVSIGVDGRIFVPTEFLKKEKTTYIIPEGETPSLHFNEAQKTWQVKVGAEIYPLFDEEKGLACFETASGQEICYDSRIPVKVGEEPYMEEVDGKEIIKFGPNHQYQMPYTAQNGDIYTQMRYEGRTTTVAVYKNKEIAEKACQERMALDNMLLNKNGKQM